MVEFPKREVAITLTGAQWFALLTRAVGRSLSPEGARTYNEAAARLTEQLGQASEGVDGPREIIVTVDGGVVQDIQGIPPGIVVEVRDYDCEGTDETTTKDADGKTMIVGRFIATS